MNMATETKDIDCPYCGEQFAIVVDPSVPDQSYIEDCYVCCRPIQLTVQVDTDGDISVTARDENDC